MRSPAGPTLGLVLTGGGARGAYQAGVISGLSKILKSKSELPFRVITGCSAGAINGSYLASRSEDFPRAVQGLCQLWENLRFNNVISSKATTIIGTTSRWLWQTATGSLSTKSKVNHLLSTEPLVKLLHERIPIKGLRAGIEAGRLLGFAASTTNYATGSEVVFYDSLHEIGNWTRANRIARHREITVPHILASASIPIFFPPVAVDGSYFGDGSIRMRSPLSPAIRLGAEKIIAIGVKQAKSTEQLLEANKKEINQVSVADISGVLLNALFLDSMGADLERLERINRTVESAGGSNPDGLKPIQCFSITPSSDLGLLARDSLQYFPKGLRYLFSGIGAKSQSDQTGQRGQELLSYMAFEKGYTSELVKMGEADVMRQSEDLLSFIEK